MGDSTIAECSKTDGSAASTVAHCTCGTVSCASGKFCSKSANACGAAAIAECSKTDGSAASTVAHCTCGTATCVSGDFCSKPANTCATPQTTAAGTTAAGT